MTQKPRSFPRAGKVHKRFLKKLIKIRNKNLLIKRLKIRARIEIQRKRLRIQRRKTLLACKRYLNPNTSICYTNQAPSISQSSKPLCMCQTSTESSSHCSKNFHWKLLTQFPKAHLPRLKTQRRRNWTSLWPSSAEFSTDTHRTQRHHRWADGSEWLTPSSSIGRDWRS